MRYPAFLFTSFVFFAVTGLMAQEKQQLPSFDYEVARSHELQPHRHSIRLQGVQSGFNQIHLTLTVSPNGDVVAVTPNAEPAALKFWPQVQSEIRNWKFSPFEDAGKPAAAEIEEYLDLLPAERPPTKHVAPPVIRPNSEVAIALERTGCFGTCPAYTVSVSTDGIFFTGRSYVVASGTHSDSVDSDEVRTLAKRFLVADFYSMDSSYRASVTDSPTYVLSISIDGRKKEVEDYVGGWEGMPAVITDLENAVDEIAQSSRWIEGSDGLVSALKNEEFMFQTFEGQVMLKEAASRGKAETVRGLLQAGVPLEPLPAPKPEQPDMRIPFSDIGWLNAASRDLETLRVLIAADASKNDQNDKDLALIGAARSGNVAATRLLISYGADPNADLSKLIVTESGAGLTVSTQGAGSVLIYAAESGDPEMVREILRFHPRLDARDQKGRTAIFAASEYRYGREDVPRAECVRLLAEAGADVNARDNSGNTALHETFLTGVEEELLKLGANVNARNDDGETPIFTTVDDSAIPLFIAHGADITIRNDRGETVLDAAKDKGPLRQEALRKAIQKINRP